MSQLSIRRVFLFTFLPLLGYLINTTLPAESSEITRPIDFRTSGIRFRIAASIKADPAFSDATQYYDHSQASLVVKIRISAHARESNYFGEISETVSNFLVNEGSPEKLYWQDARCHQRRGLPKTTVTAVDGFIAAEKGQISIHARPRQLGLPLPLDEIIQGIRLPSSGSDHGAFVTYRSQLKQSHLFVDVNIYASACDLAAEYPPIAPAETNRGIVPSTTR